MNVDKMIGDTDSNFSFTPKSDNVLIIRSIEEIQKLLGGQCKFTIGKQVYQLDFSQFGAVNEKRILLAKHGSSPSVQSED